MVVSWWIVAFLHTDCFHNTRLTVPEALVPRAWWAVWISGGEPSG